MPKGWCPEYFYFNPKLEEEKSIENIWKEIQYYSGEFFIDDIEKFLQTQSYNWFFDFLNILKEKQGVIVATTSTSPSIWDISLQDLKSRLLLIPVLKISDPGDSLLFHIIKKLAKDLGTKIADNCVQYILNNFPRNIQEIRNLINTLNKFSLKKKQSISVQFIKKYAQKSTN